MKYKPIMIVPFAATLCLIFASVASAQTTRIKVGYSSIGVGQSLVWVAKEAGLFKENGLDVQLIFIGSSSIVTQAVIAGDMPIAIMSGSTAIGSQLAGADLVIAASTKKDPAQAFLGYAKVYAGVAGNRPTVHQRHDQRSEFFRREQEVLHGRDRPLYQEHGC